MKIFSHEKFKRDTGYDTAWARESDGHIVRGREILGTDYLCYGLDVDRWCIDYTLKPGDKVRIANKRGEYWDPAGRMDKYMGKVMTVRAIRLNNGYGIEMEEGKDENGSRNWWFTEHDLTEVLTAFDHAEPEESDVTVELHFCGRETTAMLVKGTDIVKTAVARCHPADEYDRGEGAKIAVNRLFVPEQYYNGKVVCIATGYSWWKVGKVYNVVDGFIANDNGIKYPKFGAPYKDTEDVKHAGTDDYDDRHDSENTFVPLIED
jgi:hypothetical protein